METKQIIENFIDGSIEANKKMFDEGQILYRQIISNKIIEAYQKGKKLKVFRNGSSASDVLHFAPKLFAVLKKTKKQFPK